MSGCDRELNAHIYSAASLKYYVPDTWHDTTPSHIILTLGRPVLVLPESLSAKRGTASTIFYDFGMSRPGIEPVTSRSPERTLYQLSYRGHFDANVSTNDVLLIQNYDCPYKNDTTNHGGGILVYIDSNLVQERVTELELFCQDESIWFKIRQKSSI